TRGTRSSAPRKVYVFSDVGMIEYAVYYKSHSEYADGALRLQVRCLGTKSGAAARPRFKSPVRESRSKFVRPRRTGPSVSLESASAASGRSRFADGVSPRAGHL